MQAVQPYNPKTLFHFKYNIETKIVEQEEALVKEYDMQRFYHNMPEGFSDTNVIAEDREIYNNMYHRLEAGENYATAEFRVTSDLHWARVTLYRESPGSCVFQGIVQDVSEQYEWIVQQAKQRENRVEGEINFSPLPLNRTYGSRIRLYNLYSNFN